MGLKTLKLAIFISGRGSNMLSIMRACKDPDFAAEISVVLSNRPDAQGLKTAKDAGIATEIVDHKKFKTREEFEEEITKRLKYYEFDIIVLAGFMRILTDSFVKKFPRKIINIHPSLLPAYKGLNTHERALADGQREAGCSVHYVIPELDSGEVILQKKVPVLDDDTPQTLADRVLEQEHIAYPEAIKILSKNI